jgi:hypothetical protein
MIQLLLVKCIDNNLARVKEIIVVKFGSTFFIGVFVAFI